MSSPLPKFLISPESDTAVLFIHGLGGSFNTWYNFCNKLNTEWNEKDSFSLEYDDYYNSVRKIPVYTFLVKNFFGKSIDSLAIHLDSYIKTVCDKYKHIILVCHSMGGLVARKYIINLLNKDRHIGKIKALITYATPHHGATLANISKTLFYKPISVISFGSLKLFSQLKDLSKNGTFIKTLNSEWSNLKASSKLDFYRVVGMADWVVSESSASYELDDNVIPCANKDHFSIINPHPHINDVALFVTYNYLKKFNEILDLKESLEKDGYTEEDDLEF